MVIGNLKPVLRYAITKNIVRIEVQTKQRNSHLQLAIKKYLTYTNDIFKMQNYDKDQALYIRLKIKMKISFT